MKYLNKRFLALTLTLLLIFAFAACSKPAEEAKTEEAPATTAETSTEKAPEATQETSSTTPEPEKKEFEPFSVVTYEDVEVTYDHVPEKVVSFNLHTSENLMALGLGDKIIGTSYNNAEILPEYKEAYAKIPALSEKYPSFEVLLGAGPDFVYGRSSAFKEKSVAPVITFVENGIMPYVAKATCIDGATMEATYEDFEFLGKLFQVEDRANEIINKMKSQIASVEEKLQGTDERAKVFVFDYGTDDAFTCGKSLESDMISKAGGINVFGDIEKNWVHVSWEEIVEANPDIIVINDYGNTTADEKIKFLKENPALSDVKAVKNDRFVVLPLPSVFTGIRNGDAIIYLAESFYPELFK